jgi:thymidylate synthase (FAD)
MTVEIITPSVNVVNFDKVIGDKGTKTPSANVMEYVCRVCYNSYDKMTEGSHELLLAGAAKKGHRSIFDFSNIQFDFRIYDNDKFEYLNHFFAAEKYLNHKVYKLNMDINSITVTGSIRAFIELLERCIYTNFKYVSIFQHIFFAIEDNYSYIINNWPTFPELKSFADSVSGISGHDSVYKFSDIVKQVNMKQDKIHRKILVELITDRGLHNELVRHRPVAHMATSQRFVRYGTNKNPLKVCVDSKRFADQTYISIIKDNSEICYDNYKNLLNNGYAPQIARAALPMGTSLSSFMYCNMEEWEHIFRLRCHPSALPMAREVTNEIFQQMINKHLY